jgi:hypothetical protein
MNESFAFSGREVSISIQAFGVAKFIHLDPKKLIATRF